MVFCQKCYFQRKLSNIHLKYRSETSADRSIESVGDCFIRTRVRPRKFGPENFRKKKSEMDGGFDPLKCFPTFLSTELYFQRSFSVKITSLGPRLWVQLDLFMSTQIHHMGHVI